MLVATTAVIDCSILADPNSDGQVSKTITVAINCLAPLVVTDSCCGDVGGKFDGDRLLGTSCGYVGDDHRSSGDGLLGSEQSTWLYVAILVTRSITRHRMFQQLIADICCDACNN